MYKIGEIVEVRNNPKLFGKILDISGGRVIFETKNGVEQDFAISEVISDAEIRAEKAARVAAMEEENNKKYPLFEQLWNCFDDKFKQATARIYSCISSAITAELTSKDEGFTFDDLSNFQKMNFIEVTYQVHYDTLVKYIEKPEVLKLYLYERFGQSPIVQKLAIIANIR